MTARDNALRIIRFDHPERSGRPMGSDGFIARLEDLLGRLLRRQRPDPKSGSRRRRRGRR